MLRACSGELDARVFVLSSTRASIRVYALPWLHARDNATAAHAMQHATDKQQATAIWNLLYDLFSQE